MTVHLVGAGPGDPGLITVRGFELVRSCDVLVYDRLAAPELVEEAPDDAIRIARDPLDQSAVNGLLVGFGRAGLEVVRLKGGDPFVFGRGGEEALALAEAGVRFEVVAGVSSLSAVPAAAGVPVTHRGLASQAILASGTTGEQESAVSTLAAIANAAAELDPPALVVIGEVVALSERLRTAAPSLVAAD